jgi:hypothetical protein
MWGGCVRNDSWPRSPRPVRRPPASVELPQATVIDAIGSLRRIAEGKCSYPTVMATALADILAAALEQARAEDRR